MHRCGPPAEAGHPQPSQGNGLVGNARIGMVRTWLNVHRRSPFDDGCRPASTRAVETGQQRAARSSAAVRASRYDRAEERGPDVRGPGGVVVTARVLPCTPRSATALRIGDLIGVQGTTARWACLQVVELMPRKRTSFIVALLPWQGDGPPMADTVRGLPPIERASTRIEVFTEGGLQVVDTTAPRRGASRSPMVPSVSVRTAWQALEAPCSTKR